MTTTDIRGINTPLSPWTRAFSDKDAGDLLDAASPGLPLSEWRDLCHCLLPQAARARRQELVRMVERDLLDHDGSFILDAVFLNLFQHSSPYERNTLLFGRLAPYRPLVALALDRLLHPALLRADEPFGRDAAVIPESEWDSLIQAALPPGTRAETVTRTRQTLQRFLAAAGVLVIDVRIVRTVRVQRARPASVAFGWLIAHELRGAHRTEASVSWAITDSAAARLFALERNYALTCLDAAVDAGVLIRGYLAGTERLHPGPFTTRRMREVTPHNSNF